MRRTLIVLSILLFTIIITPVTSSSCYGCDLWSQAEDYYNQGQYNSAISTLRQALNWADSNAQTRDSKEAAWEFIGRIYEYGLKDYQSATDAYKNAGVWKKAGRTQNQVAKEMANNLPDNPTSQQYRAVGEAYGNALNYYSRDGETAPFRYKGTTATIL